MPSLSIVIPVYRQLRCLDLTLSALAAQQPPPADFEIIVVDDGSRDETDSVVGSFQGSLPVRLVRLDANRGRAAARNAGVAAADADRLLLLDADSYADPGLLDAHVRFGASFPEQVLLGARAESTWLPLAGAAATRADASGGYSRDVRLKLGLDAKTFPVTEVPWYFAFSHNMSLPTADFLGCGGFDENFTGWGFEDIEFGYRLHVASGRRPGYFQFDPLAMCHHLPHFRSAESNWMQAGPMLPYFVEKHRSLEIEFIDEGPQVVVDLLPAYLSRLALLHRADRITAKQALATLPTAAEPGRLVIGIGLAECLPADGLTEGIDHQPPDPRTTPGLIGLRLPYPNGKFADLVNLDLWRVLTPDHLSRMVLECLRAAGTVHLGYSAQVTATELISSPDYVLDMLSGYCEVTLSEPTPGLLWIAVQRKLP
jgi:GT2 family glycosyltransferase